jgi:phosphatidylinositol glycan class K
MAQHEIAFALVFVLLLPTVQLSPVENTIKGFFKKGGNHTNNWAVLVSTSRFWFNYRHSANVLSIYRVIKSLGFPDSHIILMLADDMVCNPRNPFPAQIFQNTNKLVDLYGENIEVDYRGYEVNVENFIRLLTGRHDPSVPRSKRLLSDRGSNILVYMTGHGGNEFLKFQDNEEISSKDIADCFQQMWQKQRYNEILFMVDTCQANTLYNHFYSPNILAIGSSDYRENSYSHHADSDIGVAIIDRFTYYTLEFFQKHVRPDSNTTIAQLFRSYDPALLNSHALWRDDLYPRDIENVYITEFFGSLTPVHVTHQKYPLMKSLPMAPSVANNETQSSFFISFTSFNIDSKTVKEDVDAAVLRQQITMFNSEFLGATAIFFTLLLGASFISL